MSVLDSLRKLNELDISNLDLENMGDWPDSIKATICAIAFGITLLLGYQFHITDLLRTYEHKENTEQQLKTQYSMKAVDAANLNAYLAKWQKWKCTSLLYLDNCLQTLKFPVYWMILTSTARGAGLQVEHIQLKPEIANEFYIELPISILVKGTYHDFGHFVSGTASLSRIVTLHDLTVKTDNESDQLAMEILAKTYRYNETGGKK